MSKVTETDKSEDRFKAISDDLPIGAIKAWSSKVSGDT